MKVNNGALNFFEDSDQSPQTPGSIQRYESKSAARPALLLKKCTFDKRVDFLLLNETHELYT